MAAEFIETWWGRKSCLAGHRHAQHKIDDLEAFVKACDRFVIVIEDVTATPATGRCPVVSLSQDFLRCGFDGYKMAST